MTEHKTHAIVCEQCGQGAVGGGGGLLMRTAEDDGSITVHYMCKKCFDEPAETNEAEAE